MSINPSTIPAGDARREAMRQVADDLAQAAEEQGVEGGAIRPDAFEIDNEIAGHFNELEVTNALPEYEYCWVNYNFGGRFIKEKQSHRVREGSGLQPVWEVVHGEMPEAPELRGIGADTTRRLGDVLLMRARKDRALLLRRHQTIRQRALEGAPEAALNEMGDKYGHLGVKIHTQVDPNSQIAKLMGARGMEMREAAVQVAMKAVDQMLRSGNMSSLPGGPRRSGR